MRAKTDIVAGPLGATFTGYFDRFEQGEAGGWVINTDRPLSPTAVHVVIDMQEVATLEANQPRPDITTILAHPTGNVGFLYRIPDEYWDDRDHTISFRLKGGGALPYLDPARPSEMPAERVFRLRMDPTITGYVDGFRQGQIHGWVTRTEPRATKAVGRCHVRVTCEGQLVADLRADRYRADAAAATGCDPNCGFQLTVPRRFRDGGVRSFRFAVMPEEIEIAGSPMRTSAVDDELEASLLDAASQVDELFRNITRLRKRMQELLPQPGYNLADYDRWARLYYASLRNRVAAERPRHHATDRPLVSILMPTYRPQMSDFVAAVESVFAQTYPNWELIIVDDCSRQPDLTKQIEAFCSRDTRVRAVVRKRNGNISEATNTAIRAARGTWVAFFDHDDLLVDVAVELMVTHAAATGALMLYSDEDKVDQAGYFLEPNFKPDWNYRYMLGCNYVCHLLFVDRDTLKAAGPLRTKYDGAQDHDLILRLAEIVAREKIHHVPEMLYHWRKTPNSTASDISRKSYAVDAGIAAVTDHLVRRGITAVVESINGLTIYRQRWKTTGKPRVCIIIPFRDQIPTTRQCLETVLQKTAYKNFEVILIDNWSGSAEAASFVREATRDRRVRVLRVEEEFNFSRLNNLAAAETKAEFLLFMNNDLFPTSRDWLQLLLDEALVDPNVAVVAGRYLYPNGTIQHAGVVVGPNGLAAHAHRGAPDGDYGFIGRIVLSHELTAVTAACMLVRAAVFRQVGGFDEQHLKVAFNDVDLCLKIRSAGYAVVYCADMIAEHHESLSRGSDERPEHEARFLNEQAVLRDRWQDVALFRHDPAYSRYLTVDRQTFYDLVTPESARA